MVEKIINPENVCWIVSDGNDCAIQFLEQPPVAVHYPWRHGNYIIPITILLEDIRFRTFGCLCP